MVILMVNSELKTFTLPFPNERGERKIWVYIPSHSEDEKLPVIYMTDGQNLFDEESTEYGSWNVISAVENEQNNTGLTAMKKRNEEKAKILYDFLDQSEMFKGTVVKEDRSLMNVPFVTGDKDLDAKFVAEAKEAGFENLKGHRTVGGMRASIYNAMPKEGVEKLVAFMKKFEEENK